MRDGTMRGLSSHTCDCGRLGRWYVCEASHRMRGHRCIWASDETDASLGLSSDAQMHLWMPRCICDDMCGCPSAAKQMHLCIETYTYVDQTHIYTWKTPLRKSFHVPPKRDVYICKTDLHRCKRDLSAPQQPNSFGCWGASESGGRDSDSESGGIRGHLNV